MKKLFLFICIFALGAISVLRYQHYNRYTVETDSISERIKNVVDGVAQDYTRVSDKLAEWFGAVAPAAEVPANSWNQPEE